MSKSSLPVDSSTIVLMKPSARQAYYAELFQTIKKPFNPRQLPWIVELKPGLDRRNNERLILKVAIGFVALISSGVWLTDEPFDPVMFIFGVSSVPLTLLTGVLWVRWIYRGVPDWFRLRLSVDKVRMESPKGQWEEPVAHYLGLAVRHRVTYRPPPRWRKSLYTELEKKFRHHELITLYWIELVHADTSRTIVLWASDKARVEDVARKQVEQFAKTLSLPVIQSI